MNNSLVLGKKYRLYGKMEGMKKFMPVCGGDFVTKVFRADIFECNEINLPKMEAELKYLAHQGTFEFREIK